MCGIVGILRLEGAHPRSEELHAMCDVLRHRGPDSGGVFLCADLGLAMRRLSIIDLEGGAQPVRNEDATVWAVFNGEIYNFRELRDDLERRGHAFQSGSDTEVIVHLYEEHGVQFVERLRGMFAIAVWDTRRRRLVLVRDRLGIKPLYYAEVNGRLVFASELKALLQLHDVERRLDWHAVDHLFSSLVTPPSSGIVAGVKKLEPGHRITASPVSGIHVEPYWQFRIEPNRRRSLAASEEELRARLQESVRLHLVSDVPVGAFLSGGIDSSAVVAAMSRLSSRPVKTFTVGFGERDYDESGYAALVAERFETEHIDVTLQPDVLDLLDELTWYLDEPFGDSSAIPTYVVSRLAAQHVKVALSGDGGDELFAGYDRYRVERRERLVGLLPKPFRAALRGVAEALPAGFRGRNLLRHLSLDEFDRYRDATALFGRAEKARLFRKEALDLMPADESWRDDLGSARKACGHWLSSLQWLDVQGYLPLDILTKVDRMSMAHSLETRVPLLDHELVEFAGTIPPEWNLNGGTSKYLFKRALRDILPPAILRRGKKGFAVPLGRWFRGRLSEFLRELLLSPTARQRGIFDPFYIERLIERHRLGGELDLQLWTLVSFELWCRRFLDRAPSRYAAADENDVGSAA
jgi:asparagine synthase (glutamine-hydrolysing)